jgi:hypothetical protein
MALARRIEAAQARGETFRIGVWTGASTAPAGFRRENIPPHLLEEAFRLIEPG